MRPAPPTAAKNITSSCGNGDPLSVGVVVPVVVDVAMVVVVVVVYQDIAPSKARAVILHCGIKSIYLRTTLSFFSARVPT